MQELLTNGLHSQGKRWSELKSKGQGTSSWIQGRTKKIGWLESEGGWMVFQCIKNFQFWALFCSPSFFHSFPVDEWGVSQTLKKQRRFISTEVAFLWAKNIFKCCLTLKTCQAFPFLLSCSYLVLTYKIYCPDFEQGESFSAKCPICLSALKFPKCLCCVTVFSPQVGEIIKIMKAYINMIVKKRCSVKSATSVDSHASIWTRWYGWTGTSLVMGICSLPAQV